MDIDFFGLLIQGILTGFGALAAGAFEVSLQHPWIPLVIVASILLPIVVKSRRRRRYGYR